MVDFANLKFYKSANNGKGGPIDTAAEIISSTPINLFTNIARDEVTGGTTQYRCFYFKNTSIEDMDNFKLFLSSGTPLDYTSINFAFDGLANPFDGTVGFDGVDDYIDCTNDTDLWSRTLTKFCFAFWIYVTAAWDGNERVVVSHGGASNQGFRCIIDSAVTGRIKFIIKDSGGTSHQAQNGNLEKDKWQHIICSYDSTLGSDNMEVYVDGVPGTPHTFNSTINLSSTLTISEASTDFKGYMNDFKYWHDSATDDTEALALFEDDDFGVEPSYHLNFAERTGTTTKDRVSKIKLATFTNGTFWSLSAQTISTVYDEPHRIVDDVWYGAGDDVPNIGTLPQDRYYPVWVRLVVEPDTTGAPVINDSCVFGLQFDITSGGGGSTGGTGDRTIKSFNGTSDFIQVADSAALDLNNFSISCWFRTTFDYRTPRQGDAAGQEGMLIMKGNWVNGTDFINYGMWVTDANHLRGGFEESTGTDHLAISTSLPDTVFVNDGIWHMGTITYNGTDVVLYVDAVEKDRRPTTSTPDTSTEDLWIGKNAAQDPIETQFFKGDMDDVYVWNTAISAGEISNLFNNNNVPQLDNIVYENTFDTPTGGGGGGVPPPSADWKIAIAGDWGCEPETDANISLIKSRGYDLVLGVGDNAYESASCWTGKFTTLKDKMESAFGNHEYSESGGTSPYKNFFGYSVTYNSIRFQNVLILLVDDNHDIESESGAPTISSQKSWVISELEKYKNDSKVVWRIVVMHHPWFGSGGDHPENEGGQVQVFHKTLTDYGVNFLYMGHNHNWQRTHQLAYNASNPRFGSIVDSSSPYSRTAGGLIGIVSGTGGHDSGGGLYGLPSSNAIHAYLNRSHNGIHELVASNNGLTLTGKFVDKSGDTFDTFVIS